MKKWLLLTVALVGLFSCKKDERRNEAERIVSEWIGKEIKFPADYECSLLGKDTTLCTDLLNREYRILLYVDSMGCTSCKLRMYEWKRLIAESDSLFANRLSFLFFFYPKNKKELRFLFKRDYFDYPAFIDDTNQINALNSFPDKQSYQCFLLDKDNKVVMIGNPTLNPKIWELYKERISGSKTVETGELTSLEVESQTCDLGTVKTGESRPAVFRLKNTGHSPLIISHVSTSCDCTSVDWEKQPVEPGKTAEIRAEMRPEEEGYFNKTLEVYCNINESPVKLTIGGKAVK